MKKIWLILAVIVAIAAAVGAFFLLTPDGQKLKLALDNKVKPEIERWAKDRFDKDVELVYANYDSQEHGLVLYDLALQEKAHPDVRIVAKTALLSELTYDTNGWGLSIQLDDISSSGLKGEVSGKRIRIGKFRTNFDGSVYSLDDLGVDDIKTSQGKDQVSLAKLNLTGMSLDQGDHFKLLKGSLEGLEADVDQNTSLSITNIFVEGLETSPSQHLVVLTHAESGPFKTRSELGDFSMERMSVSDLYLDKENVFQLGQSSLYNLVFRDPMEGLDIKSIEVSGIPRMDLDEPHTWHFGESIIKKIVLYSNDKQIAAIDSITGEALSSDELISQALRINNAVMERDLLDPEDQRTMDDLGLEKIVVSMELDYELDLKKDFVNLKKLSITGEDMGDFDLQAQLSGVHIDPANPDASLAACQNTAAINNLEMKYKDSGLVRKSIAMAAKEAKMSYDDFVAQQNETMMKQFEAMNSPEMTSFGEALAKFVADPESLVIRLNPPEPVLISSMVNMQNQAQRAKALGLEAEAN